MTSVDSLEASKSFERAPIILGSFRILESSWFMRLNSSSMRDLFFPKKCSILTNLAREFSLASSALMVGTCFGLMFILNLQIWLSATKSTLIFSWLTSFTLSWLFRTYWMDWKGGACTWLLWISCHCHFFLRTPFGSSSKPPLDVRIRRVLPLL